AECARQRGRATRFECQPQNADAVLDVAVGPDRDYVEACERRHILPSGPVPPPCFSARPIDVAAEITAGRLVDNPVDVPIRFIREVSIVNEASHIHWAVSL